MTPWEYLAALPQQAGSGLKAFLNRSPEELRAKYSGTQAAEDVAGFLPGGGIVQDSARRQFALTKGTDSPHQSLS